jgi:hypothetical protein
VLQQRFVASIIKTPFTDEYEFGVLSTGFLIIASCLVSPTVKIEIQKQSYAPQ